MSAFRDKIKTYVDANWMVPCEDGLVWVYYDSIKTNEQIALHKKATGKDFVAAFLQYPDPQFVTLEGLYLIPPSDLAKVRAGQFDATKYTDRKMISSWFDVNDKNGNNAEVKAQKPPYNGLNDCAHFVTQSVTSKAGIEIDKGTRGVGELLNSLQALADTKTLCQTLKADDAEPIIKSGVMDVGDVIIYSKGSEHHHSVVYMGNAKIAMHTWANHPDHPQIHGDWKKSATDDHPLVTLIHFGRDDTKILPDSGMLGWWKVLWRGGTFYYFFEKSGRVSWTQQKPTNLKLGAHAAGGRGHWFIDANKVTMCWASTGSVETLAVTPPKPETHMEGQWTSSAGTDRIFADKM